MQSFYRSLVSSVLFWPVLVIAAKPVQQHYGLAGVANNLMEPVSILANFIGSMSIVIGLSFLLATILKYLQHRVNPMAVPISTVVLLLIMGVLLVGIPFLYKLVDTGIPISL
jgi:hypothetical protein